MTLLGFLKIRLPSNESVTISLLASALLSEVFSRVRGAAPSLADKQFDLLTTFPKRRFSATDINTLAGAGPTLSLHPRVSLILFPHRFDAACSADRGREVKEPMTKEDSLVMLCC